MGMAERRVPTLGTPTLPPKSEGREPHWSVDRVSWPPGTSFPLQERMLPAILQLFIQL